MLTFVENGKKRNSDGLDSGPNPKAMRTSYAVKASTSTSDSNHHADEIDSDLKWNFRKAGCFELLNHFKNIKQVSHDGTKLINCECAFCGVSIATKVGINSNLKRHLKRVNFYNLLYTDPIGAIS